MQRNSSYAQMLDYFFAEVIAHADLRPECDEIAYQRFRVSLPELKRDKPFQPLAERLERIRSFHARYPDVTSEDITQNTDDLKWVAAEQMAFGIAMAPSPEDRKRRLEEAERAYAADPERLSQIRTSVSRYE